MGQHTARYLIGNDERFERYVEGAKGSDRQLYASVLQEDPILLTLVGESSNETIGCFEKQ